MQVPLKWSYRTGIDYDWAKSTATRDIRIKALKKVFSSTIAGSSAIMIDDKSSAGDGSTVRLYISEGDWKGEYFLSLPTQKADDSVNVGLCMFWRDDVFFLTTDAIATAWDGGNYDIQKSRLSAHLLMYACRIAESDGTSIYYIANKQKADGTESRLLDVFPMLDRPLNYSDKAQYFEGHQILPAYPINSADSDAKNGSPVFGNLPNHMPGVFYSPEGEIGHEKNYSITMNGRSIRMCATGSVFFLVDA